MHPALYILAEGEKDELFYERVCERVTGLTFQPSAEYRYSPGANWKTVFRLARLALSKFSRYSSPQEIALLIAVDNDRAPGHPGGLTYPRTLPPVDAKKEPRYEQLQQMVTAALGVDQASRAVQALVAVPVEMIESWLLLLHDPARTENSLPLFSEADSASARQYYGGHPPPQLKDECARIRREQHLDAIDQFFRAADTGDLDHLRSVSRSFDLFWQDLEALRRLWNDSTAD